MELAGQLGEDLDDRRCSAGRSRNDVERRGPALTDILLREPVEQMLRCRAGVHSGEHAGVDAESALKHKRDRCQAVGLT